VTKEQKIIRAKVGLLELAQLGLLRVLCFAYRRIQLVRWGHPPAARMVAVEAPPLLP
jgi:hypothetical protein